MPHRNFSKFFISISIALLMSLACYIRMHGANTYHYYGDEWAIIQIASGTTLKQVLQFSVFETHPPLLYVVLHYWIKISTAPAFVRSLSLLFGLALIPIYYRIGKLLNSELTGLSCATLIVFSHGCIIQSYIVRHYTLLLFMLSAALYYYLLWRGGRKNIYLIAYILFASLACLTHFSAIYAIFCITTYETMRMVRTARRIEYSKWISANCIVAAIFITTFLLWDDSLLPMHAAVDGVLSTLSLSDRILLTLLYPFYLAGYVFPNPYFIAPLLLLTPIALVNKDKNFRLMLQLSGYAVLFGMLLFISNIYPFSGDRHSLWALPFLIIAAGQIMAVALKIIVAKIKTKSHFSKIPAAPLSAMAIIILCLVFYNPSERFSDSNEYKIKESQWQQIENYLYHISPTNLLIASRVEATIFAPKQTNMYGYLENSQYAFSTAAGYAPYYNTHLLFNNRRDVRIYSNIALATMLENAQAKGLLNDYGTLIFVHSYHINGPVIDLITCKALDKTIVAFPAAEPGHVFTPPDIADNYNVIFIVIKKQDFFDEVIASNGKAHTCLFSQNTL